MLLSGSLLDMERTTIGQHGAVLGDGTTTVAAGASPSQVSDQSVSLCHRSYLFLPHAAEEDKNRGREGESLKERIFKEMSEFPQNCQVCTSHTKMNTSPSLLLRLWPPLISPFSLFLVVCKVSLLNTAFCSLSEPASVDQYKPMLGIHSLHHLTVKQRVLQLWQAQAI